MQQPDEGRSEERPFPRAGTSTVEGARADEAPPQARSGTLRRPDGVELIGPFEGSGYKETPYLARRPDGQVVQISKLLYLVTEAAEGRSPEQVASAVSDGYGKTVSADNVTYLVDNKLRPLGLIANPDGTTPEVKKADPFLALNVRAKVIPAGVVRAISTSFRPLFFPPIVIAAIAGLIAMDVWLFGVHGVGGGLRHVLYEPVLMLLVLGLVVASAALHECGHATACAYGGAKPGGMGVGIYMVWPVFYTDVTDAYRLGRGGRLRTDLGGLYFNVLFSLTTFGIYALTGFEALLLVIVIQHLEMLHQLLPFGRMDGYYIVADLTGVPDLFTRIKPILVSFLPGREPDERVRQLKRWARVTVTVWVLVVVPLLLYVLIALVVTLPRILATAGDSIGKQYGVMTGAFGEGNLIGGVAGLLQILAVALPVAGMIYTLVKSCRGLGRACWRTTDGRPIARAFVVALGLAAATGLAMVWWPNGEYRPIRPNEQLTINDTLVAARAASAGEPAITHAADDPAEQTDPMDTDDTTDPTTDDAEDTGDTTTSTEGTTSPSPEPSPTFSSEPSPSPSPTLS